MPRFDRPRLARSLRVVPDGAIPAHPPLPALDEPERPPVTAPSDEPLVPIAHRRIRVLANYWHGGWEHAHSRSWLRGSVLERLARVAESLPEPWGLAVFDAWRPLDLQAELWGLAYQDPALPEGFVARPDPDPTTPPPHLSGGAVDLTLTYQGTPLELGTAFDAFTDAARSDFFEDTPGKERDARRFLYWSMRSEDFVVVDCEWWHYEYGTRRWGALTGNQPLYGAAEPPA